MLGVGFTSATVSGRAADVPPPGAGVNTVMLGVPAAAISLAGMAAVSCVDETNVVVRLAPLTWTIEPLVKLEPVAVRVKAAPPAEAVVGLMLERIGAGVTDAVVLGAAMLALTLFDAHTAFAHGAGFVTTTARVPWLATSVACTAILICVAESTVTVRAWPPTAAVAPVAKPVPVTVSVKAALPAVTLAGLTLVMVGVGFEMVSERAPEVPPPGAGVNTVMLGFPAATISLAVMAAVSCVDETNVVVRLTPLTWTIEPLVKLEPVAVRVKAAPPAEAVVGLMLERIGAGVGAAMIRARGFEVPPPDPGVDTPT